jgi:hypothetical protein
MSDYMNDFEELQALKRKFPLKEIRAMFIKQNSMIVFADELSKEMMWSGYFSAFARLDLVDMDCEEVVKRLIHER